jgi:hypothetical protein
MSAIATQIPGITSQKSRHRGAIPQRMFRLAAEKLRAVWRCCPSNRSRVRQQEGVSREKAGTAEDAPHYSGHGERAVRLRVEVKQHLDQRPDLPGLQFVICELAGHLREGAVKEVHRAADDLGLGELREVRGPEIALAKGQG